MKIQYRWGMLGEDTEKSTAMTGVDTKTMMHSERMSLPLWYHIVLILILAVPFAFKGFRIYLGTFSGEFTGLDFFFDLCNCRRCISVDCMDIQKEERTGFTVRIRS